MKSFYIYFDDLKEDVQDELLAFAGVSDAGEMNWDILHVATVDLEENNGKD